MKHIINIGTYAFLMLISYSIIIALVKYDVIQPVNKFVEAFNYFLASCAAYSVYLKLEIK